MKRIGQGYYYNVFDLGNGRVLKKETNFFARFRKFVMWHGKTRLQKIETILKYSQLISRNQKALFDSVRVSTLDPKIFGNPTFTKGFEYEQDLVVPLGEYFKTHSFEENRVRFNEYIGMQYTLWGYGISDTVFNFTINTGVSTRTDKLITIDFNEMARSKELVQDDIRTKKWLTQYSLKNMTEGELKNYIISKMEKCITLEKLAELWIESEK